MFVDKNKITLFNEIGRTNIPFKFGGNMKTKIDPITKKRLYEEIVNQLQTKILKGELKAGEKLSPERDLAKSFEVNRSTVREAIKKLELLGLVNIYHGDGIYVKNYLESGNLEILKSLLKLEGGLNNSTISDLLKIRILLIPEMTKYAAKNISDKLITKIEKILSIENTSFTPLEKDLKIHHIIAEASNNIFYIFILNFFNELFRENGDIYFSQKENILKTEKFHYDILESLKNKDEEKSAKIMKDILEYTMSAII